MRSFERRQKQSHVTAGFWAKSAGALFLLLLMILTARGAWGMYERFAAASGEAAAAEAELEELIERERQMAGIVESLSTERGVEAEIRERYGLALPGEGRIEIVRNSNDGEPGAEADEKNILFRIFQSLFVW